MRTIFTIAILLIALATRAGGTFSMIEINPMHGTQSSLFSFPDSSKMVYGGGELTGFVELNGKLYFSGSNGYEREALWSTDGTQQGTQLVKEINPHGNAGISNIVKVGNRLVFMAADSNNYTWDVWSSDGTTNGTTKLSDANQFTNTGLSPQNVALMGNQLLFCTTDKLYITDGTTAGTQSLLYISSYSQGYGYCELNNKVYFILPNVNGNPELWRTDGTKTGTEKVFDLKENDSINTVNQMIAFNGKLYLIAATNWSNLDLYSFDGNMGGHLQRVMSPTPGVNRYPQNLTLYNNALYYVANDGTSSNLFRITTGSAIPQALITNASANTYISQLTFANSSAYFTMSNTSYMERINLNTLQHTSNYLGGRYMPWYIYEEGMLIGLGNKLYFAAYDSITNNQVLIESSEDLQTITEIKPSAQINGHPFNFLAGCGTADIFDFKVWNNKLLLPANFNEAGRELWFFEPASTTTGIEEVKKQTGFIFYPNPANNELTITTTNSGYCDQQVVITDVAGEKVLTGHINATSALINVTPLAAGNYFISLFENSKAVSTQRLVISK